ncbi:MAG: hypothetical protein PXZ07_02115 [Candidatus Eremiobacteraeota bacterium]|nr:hypothetical protein [Candidatus Eremiobacteraeota bacterium]
MNLRRSFLLGCAFLLGIGALAACSSGSSSGPGTTTPPAAPALTVNLIGSLQSVGQTAVLQVSQQGYLGPFTITSSNGAVLGLQQKLQSTQRAPKAAGPQTIISPNGQAYVSALSPGSASLTFNGYGGLIAVPTQLQNITVGTATPSPSPSPTTAPTPTPVPTPTPTPTPNPLAVAPSSLALTGTGASNAQTLVVTETGYTGTFTESDTCSTIATVTPSSGAGPSFTFTVTGVNAGTCTATFADTNGQHVTANIGVTTTGVVIQ